MKGLILLALVFFLISVSSCKKDINEVNPISPKPDTTIKPYELDTIMRTSIVGDTIGEDSILTEAITFLTKEVRAYIGTNPTSYFWRTDSLFFDGKFKNDLGVHDGKNHPSGTFPARLIFVTCEKDSAGSVSFPKNYVFAGGKGQNKCQYCQIGDEKWESFRVDFKFIAGKKVFFWKNCLIQAIDNYSSLNHDYGDKNLKLITIDFYEK